MGNRELRVWGTEDHVTWDECRLKNLIAVGWGQASQGLVQVKDLEGFWVW